MGGREPRGLGISYYYTWFQTNNLPIQKKNNMMKILQRTERVSYSKQTPLDLIRRAVYTTAVRFGGLMREAIRVLADRNPFVDILRAASCS